MTGPVQQPSSGSGSPSDPGTYQHTKLNAAQLATVASRSGFPKDQISTAIAVALAESKGDVGAFNNKPPDLSYGLWQINMYGSLGPARRTQFGIPNNETLFGWEANGKAAFTIWKGSGWSAWSTYKNGTYLANMPAAILGANFPQDPGLVSAVDQGGVSTQIDILKPFEDLFSWMLTTIGPFMLRVAGFVGGGLLVLIGLILYFKSQLPNPAKLAKQAVT